MTTLTDTYRHGPPSALTEHRVYAAIPEHLCTATWFETPVSWPATDKFPERVYHWRIACEDCPWSQMVRTETEAWDAAWWHTVGHELPPVRPGA